MGVFWTRPFTGADADPWTDHGFAIALGTEFQAILSGNQGAAGATGVERIYVSTATVPTPDHAVSVDLTWLDASGSSDGPGIVTRFARDGSQGYLVEFRSNLGSSDCRIRRRRASVWATVMDWTSMGIGAATLEAGATAKVRIQNTDSGVSIKAYINATEVADVEDAHANAVLSGGRVGLYIDANSTGSDVLYDQLQVADFEDESTEPATTSGSDEVELYIDGVRHTEAELEALGIDVGVSRVSYEGGTVLTIQDYAPVGQSPLYAGAWIEKRIGGTTVAVGRLTTAEESLQPGEGHTYEVTPPIDLAQDVVLEHPTTKAPTLIFNRSEDDPDYDPALSNKSIADLVDLVGVWHVEKVGGLRDQRAAPDDGDWYQASDVAGLTTVLPDVQLSGDFRQAMFLLASFGGLVPRIETGTRKWRFVARADGATVDLALDEEHVLGSVRTDLSRNYTAGRIRGDRPEPTLVDLRFTPGSPNGLEKGWLEALEDTTTEEKRSKARDSYDVDTVTTVGSNVAVTIDPGSFEAETSEWDGGTVTFEEGAEAGNTYPVVHNTTSQIELNATAWTSGGPSPGDTFAIRGHAKLGSGHQQVGRRFKLTDSNLAIPNDACVHVKFSDGVKEFEVEAKVVAPEEGREGIDPYEIVTDLPALSLINRAVDGASNDPCEAGSTTVAEEVSVADLPTYEIDNPNHPTLRWPADGYYGTAYTADPAKWSGGGEPGRGDPGVMREYPLSVPNFTGTAAQVTAYTELLTNYVKMLSELARSATLTIHGKLDTDYVNLGQKVRVLDEAGGEVLVAAIPLIATEFDPRACTTTLYLGTLANGQYDIQAALREFQSRNNLDAELSARERLEKLLSCLGNNQEEIRARDIAPAQICASRVTSSATKPGRTVKQDLTWIEIFISWFWDLFIAQKGLTDTDDSVWMRQDGQWYWSEDGGETWHVDGDSSGPISEGGAGKDAGDEEAAQPPVPSHPDDLAPGSIEGMMWAAIQGILANLGKTLDMATGQVIPPGTVNNGANNPNGNVWEHFGHDESGGVSRTPVDPDSPAPPTDHDDPTKPGVLHNLGKTTDAEDGGVKDPGDSAAEGDTHYPPGGDEGTVLEDGDTVPASTLSMLLALMRRTVGLTVESLLDQGGPVFAGPGGSVLVRPKPTSYSTSDLEVVEHTPGTGTNGGDYTPTSPGGGSPTGWYPVIHKQFRTFGGSGGTVAPSAYGEGVNLPAGSDTNGETEQMSIPSGPRGHVNEADMPTRIILRGDGGGGGNARVNVLARHASEGAPMGAYTPIGSHTVALPDDGSTTAIEFDLPADPGAGGGLVQVKLERETTHADDTSPDGVNVTAIDVDVPVLAGGVPA